MSATSNTIANTIKDQHLKIPETEVILTSPPSSPLPKDWESGGNEEDGFQWIEPPPCQETLPLNKEEGGKRVLNFKNNKKIVIELY